MEFHKILSSYASFLLIYFLFFTPSLAQNFWSFDDNPHPKYEEFSKQEKDFYNQNLKPYPLLTTCYKTIDTQYQIYQNRYPEFQKSGDKDINFKNWKRHVVKNDLVFSYSCIIGEPFEDLISYHYYYLDDERANKKFYYCGKFSSSPATDIEKNIVQTVNELIEYSKDLREKTISQTIAINELKTVIDLNPDVEYFYLSFAKKNGFSQKRRDWDVEHLLPKLSKERIAFLDEAVANNDLQSVLDSTKACEIR